ncbi:MAG TPA: acetyltransferase [Desulfobacteraceae bacterium]|nr:acetyltransferase [Desulfobacteraceae bacterium]
MRYVDVFNGDADGICALHQLRLSDPRPEAALVTGVKRDIALLARISEIENSSITVLDVSLDRNREYLMKLLGRGNSILYIDHHFSGPVPTSDQLEIHIDPQPMICTSVIVDSLLHGRYRPWAIAGAFGDNLDETALELAGKMMFDEEQIEALRATGILLNYNGYGATLDDLYFPPDELYRQVRSYEDPFAFYAESEAMEILRSGYQDDMSRALAAEPLLEDDHGRIYQLAGEPWARRVAGVFSNTLAREQPDKAHGLIIPNGDGTLRISVRAPLSNRTGADVLCRRFPTGGGRAAAAGINYLPPEQSKKFLDAFMEHFGKVADQ